MLNNTSAFYRDKKIDFEVMGFSYDDSVTLNWCVKYLDNLEKMKDNEVMEIWQEKKVKGNASLNFNEIGVILSVAKNLIG